MTSRFLGLVPDDPSPTLGNLHRAQTHFRDGGNIFCLEDMLKKGSKRPPADVIDDSDQLLSTSNNPYTCPQDKSKIVSSYNKDTMRNMHREQRKNRCSNLRAVHIYHNIVMKSNRDTNRRTSVNIEAPIVVLTSQGSLLKFAAESEQTVGRLCALRNFSFHPLDVR